MINIAKKFVHKVNQMEKNKKITILLVLAILIVSVVHLSLEKPSPNDYTQTAVAASKVTDRKLPIYSVNTDEKKVSISFDAAWGNEDTQTILDILEDNDVKATFFLCGYWVDKYPDDVRNIYEAGHDIGNHGNTHAHGAELSLEGNQREISGVHEKIKDLLGIEINLFRPPYGEYNDTVITAAESLGYHTVQWDIDSHDWMEKGVDYEINQVLNHQHLGNGSIVLFHNDTRDTPEALEPIIKGLKEKGYEIVPISELIYTENYYMDHEGRQHQE